MGAKGVRSRQTPKTAQAAKSAATDTQFRGVTIRVNPEGLKALRLLAVERDSQLAATAATLSGFGFGGSNASSPFSTHLIASRALSLASAIVSSAVEPLPAALG
jgi:hypothetical protein